MRFGPNYHNARQMQTKLLQAVCDEKTSARDRAQCAKAWTEVERLKREMRGIPPLAAAKLSELGAGMKRAKPAALKEPVELEPEEVSEAAEV